MFNKCDKQHSGLFNVLYGVQICHRKGTKGLSLGQYPQKDKFAPLSKGTLWYHSTIRYNLVSRGTYLPLKGTYCKGTNMYPCERVQRVCP